MRTHCAVLLAGFLTASAADASVVYVSDSTAPWIGFMNVFELPSNGGAFVFSSGWGVPDLVANFNDPSHTLTLAPNSVNDPSTFWYQGGGAPGSPGNKIMEANLYQEINDGSLSGQTVTFQGIVTSDSYTSAHQGSIFIRDFAPDYSSFNQTIVPVSVGPFNISLATDPSAGRHVQYGFQTLGVDVWITDTAPFGNVVIQTVPAPASLALLGLGGSVLFRRRR